MNGDHRINLFPGTKTDKTDEHTAAKPAEPPIHGIASVEAGEAAVRGCVGRVSSAGNLFAKSPDTAEGAKRLHKLRAFNALTDPNNAAAISPRAAAKKVGLGRSTAWRWAKLTAHLDLDAPAHQIIAQEILVAPATNPNAQTRGRKCEWDAVALLPDVQRKLREIHRATLGASSDAMTRDRRTGDVVTTMRLFTVESECPAELKPLLLAGKVPVCFERFITQATTEIEALMRGNKHFQLNGYSGRRDKTIGLPDGRRAHLPAGWVIELDDMSVNQPFWAEGADGQPILSRQGLYARCVKGRWLAVELIARPRESYTSADILRFVRRLCQLYGKPQKLRIEKSVWAARNISGFTLGDDPREDKFLRPAMVDDEKQNLADGLEAIGIEIEYCSSARGKSDLEGAFHPLQKYLAGFTRDFPNIGRHAGEFELAGKKVVQVRAGSRHPRDLGFPNQNQLLERIQQTFDFINALPRPKGSHDEVWASETAQWPLTEFTAADLPAFLPTLRQGQITGGAVYPKVDGQTFPFRALEFAKLGDGFKLYFRFDETEPSLGAAIYNREGNNQSNHGALKDGDFVCFARFDVPAPTTYAATVPAGLPVYSVEQLYGPGAEADGGALMKQQQKFARRFVRSAFSGRVPGKDATRTAEARDGLVVAKVQTTGSGVALPEPILPARPLPVRVTRSIGASDEDFERQAARLARDEERSQARNVAPILQED